MLGPIIINIFLRGRFFIVKDSEFARHADDNNIYQSQEAAGLEIISLQNTVKKLLNSYLTTRWKGTLTNIIY